MSDWNLPTLSSLYQDVISLLKQRDDDLATMFDGSSSTNIPINTVRWSGANKRFEKWNGTSWGVLENLYFISVDESDKVDGIHASATAEANKLLALNGSTKLPADITGDAHTVDSSHASDLLSRLNHTDTQPISTLLDHNKGNHDLLGIDAATIGGYSAHQGADLIAFLSSDYPVATGLGYLEILWNSGVDDAGAYSNGVYTCPSAGRYLVSVFIGWEAWPSGGYRYLGLHVDSSLYAEHIVEGIPYRRDQSIVTLLDVPIDTTIDVRVKHTIGSTTDIKAIPRSRFVITRLKKG